MQILHITDPHLYGNAGGSLRGVETDSSLRNVIDDAFAADLSAPAHAQPAARAQPAASNYAAILATGDIVQDDPSGYLRFKSILGNLHKPVLCIPGNHDEPETMRRSLSHPPFQYCGTRTLGAWQFILLDSYDPGHVGGRLAAGELARLEATLASCRAHALVCLHHHPVAMGSRWLDGIGLANADEFWRIIDAYAVVRGVVWGHVHQVYDGERNGVRLFATPSTCAQFLPHADRYAVDSRPPAYRHFDLADDGRIHSHVRWVAPRTRHLSMAR